MSFNIRTDKYKVLYGIPNEICSIHNSILKPNSIYKLYESETDERHYYFEFSPKRFFGFYKHRFTIVDANSKLVKLLYSDK